MYQVETDGRFFLVDNPIDATRWAIARKVW